MGQAKRRRAAGGIYGGTTALYRMSPPGPMYASWDRMKAGVTVESLEADEQLDEQLRHWGRILLKLEAVYLGRVPPAAIVLEEELEAGAVTLRNPFNGDVFPASIPTAALFLGVVASAVREEFHLMHADGALVMDRGGAFATTERFFDGHPELLRMMKRP